MPFFTVDPPLPPPAQKMEFQEYVAIINRRRMRKGYDSRSVCVCAYVCYHASCYIPGLYDANKAPLGFSRHLQGMNCVDFVENASFKSSGNIC